MNAARRCSTPGEQDCHVGCRLIGRKVHGLGLAHGVLGAVDDLVEVAGQLEQVLGLEWWVKASLTASTSCRRTSSHSCSASRTSSARSVSPAAQAAKAFIPFAVVSACACSMPRTSGVSGETSVRPYGLRNS